MKTHSLLRAACIPLSLISAQLSAQTTFNYTGAMETYTVPAGVTSIHIEAWGAQGGNGLGLTGGVGGLGGYIEGDLSVIPGQIINIFVGGQDGYNGGGIGGTVGAGYGGGATDIRIGGITLMDRIAVAGGGGGGGAEGCGTPGPLGLNGGTGGEGGSGAGGDGYTSDSGGGGLGGTLAVGGAAGIGCGGFLGLPGDNNGAGGGGQACCCFSGPTTPGGGGGGGGYVNGGGGGGGSAGTTGCSGNDKGGGGGGAGGSSYGGSMANVIITNGLQAGNGMMIITPLCSPSASSLTVIACDSYDSPSGNYSWTTSNTYMDTVLNAQGCDSVITIDLTINTVDNGISQTGPVSLSASQAGPGATYQWLDCATGNPIVGENGQTFTATANGSYAVIVTLNGCTDTSSCQAINEVGLIENDFGGQFLVYPNPTSGNVVLSLGEVQAEVSYTVTNALGQVIISEKQKNTESISLEIKGSTGYYMVDVLSSNGKHALVRVLKK